MNNIDIISYIATSTDLQTGDQISIEANYYIPFLDYYLVYSVFTFTLLITAFIYFVLKRK